MRIISFVFAALVALATTACKPAGDSNGGTSGSGAVCANGQVDLSKLSGDWLATAPVADADGKIPGSQYRLRFTAPAADGTVKAVLAWRMDSRPFTGTLEKNALGYKINLLEDMSEETMKSLRAQNNQDPGVPMRASLLVTAAEKDCQLEILDNYQSFLGEKTVEKTALGSLKMAAYAGTAPLSFVRCTASRTVWMDGKADDATGRPLVSVAADKEFTARSVVQTSQLPKECAASFSEVYVGGERVVERVNGVSVKEDGVDSVAYETKLVLKHGAVRPVELHVYAECGEAKEKKFVASLCNFAQTH